MSSSLPSSPIAATSSGAGGGKGGTPVDIEEGILEPRRGANGSLPKEQHEAEVSRLPNGDPEIGF